MSGCVKAPPVNPVVIGNDPKSKLTLVDPVVLYLALPIVLLLVLLTIENNAIGEYNSTSNVSAKSKVNGPNVTLPDGPKIFSTYEPSDGWYTLTYMPGIYVGLSNATSIYIGLDSVDINVPSYEVFGYPASGKFDPLEYVGETEFIVTPFIK